MANILLIDDDDLLRDTVLQMLEVDGHRVTEAANGEEGLKQFERKPGFDAVITDILMPGTDGTAVIVALRKRQPALPIIAISGGRRMLSSEFSLETAVVAGATLQLAKPFGRRDLQAALAQALASAPAPAAPGR
jgi:CheY-like chemotaxis protein